MAVRPTQTKQKFNWKLYGGIALVGVVLYWYTSGSDTPATLKGKTASHTTTSSTGTTQYIPADYTASFHPLKVDSKDAFKPLIFKPAIASSLDNPKGLPNSITGGGEWSYDGLVAVDGNTQALMDDQKSGESDYISLGQHWKHGKVKKITDSEIVFTGDDGSTATLKMGDSSGKEAAPAAAPAPTVADNSPVQPLTGAIGDMTLTPLPSVDQGGNGGFGRRRGGRGRRNMIFQGQ